MVGRNGDDGDGGDLFCVCDLWGPFIGLGMYGMMKFRNVGLGLY